MKLNGAKILLRCLKRLGVEIIFGYPGGAVLPIYDAIYDEKEIKHILTAHEQGATHAADGYARATGKVGVVLVTSGPGATNTVTGIATAYRDSVPMVIITGQVPLSQIGKSAFQEVDILGITTPITKKNFIVENVNDLPLILEKAFKIANEGRKGPVVIDIPKDIQVSETEYREIGFKSIDEVGASSFLNNRLKEDINKAVNLINLSERPIIYAGGGIISSGASREIIRFSEKIKSPVTCSLMALGGFPGNHKYFTGMIGMHGTRCSNYAITKCDLLIAIGARFSDRVTSKVESFAPGAKIIHIDIDEMEIGKNVRVDVPIRGDVKEVLELINEGVNEKAEGSWNHQVQEWKIKYPLAYNKNEVLSGQYIIEKLYELTRGECIITTEVGQNQIWAAQYYKYLEPRSFISSGGLGTMGFGLGAAIGAYFGNTGKKVINVAGDGSFKMNSTELATIAKYKIPIVQLVLNNSSLGMVKQWQEMFYEGRFSYTIFEDEVDFVKLGEAYKIKSIKITANEEVQEVLEYALSLNEPILIDCKINPSEKVFPMVAPGEAINNMICG
ncbi:MAG: biosynthetic-type acetolactate synthase large subunit [Clostridium sp.]|nr:biosynthetic-type acetolactate synthase large subunit [Clostridium sp.]